MKMIILAFNSRIMKKFIPFLALLLVFACDDGLIIQVPASSSVSFTLPSAVVNADDNNAASVTEVVDLANFVTEDAEQIESIKLDKFVYEVKDYSYT